MKLSDFPPEIARDLLWSIIDRYRAAKDRWPAFSGIKTEVNLTINDARLIFAGGTWLQRYDGWVREAEKAKGRVGVWPADFDLTHCARFLTERASSMNKDDPKITLTARDMRVIECAAMHLDHYSLLMAAESTKKKRYRG